MQNTRQSVNYNPTLSGIYRDDHQHFVLEVHLHVML